MHTRICSRRYSSQPKPVDYKYRFQCPDSLNYDPASHRLQLESLESFPWNTVDHVICTHGSGDHKLSDVRVNKINEDSRAFQYI